MNTFSTVFKHELEHRHYSNKDFSSLCGIPEATISRYATGQRNPTLENLIIISKHLGVSIDYLAGQSKTKYRKQEQDPESDRLLSCYQKASSDDKNVVWAALNKYAKFI